MPTYLQLPFLRVLACSALTTLSPMATASDDAFIPLQTYVGDTMKLLTPSSAMIIVSRGEEVIYERLLTGGSDGLPDAQIDANSLWPLASVTKSFSAGVLMALVEKGALDLDAPVSDHLPFMAEPGKGPHPRTTVTLRHLASHTSGLQYAGGERHGVTETVEAITEPGKVFRYSETGMNVLQAVLEAASGRSWTKLLQSEILDPLGLRATRFVDTATPTLPLVPACAGVFDDPAEHYFFTQAGSLTGSGLYSTARELNRYSQLWAQSGRLNDVRLFSVELAQEATNTHAVFDHNGAHYGLLWWVFPERGAIVMSGATHTVSAIVPQTKTVVTVTRNYFGDIPEGFVFHDDKMKLVDFAISLGQAH